MLVKATVRQPNSGALSSKVSRETHTFQFKVFQPPTLPPHPLIGVMVTVIMMTEMMVMMMVLRPRKQNETVRTQLAASSGPTRRMHKLEPLIDVHARSASDVQRGRGRGRAKREGERRF